MGQVTELKKQSVEVPAPLPKLVDLRALAELWNVPVTWLQHHTRSQCADPLPCIRLGKYVRFDLASPALATWLARRQTGATR